MESISRISSLIETARDLTLEAARDASAARKGPAKALPPQKLKALLDSRSERDVLEGLRRLVALSYTTQSISPYFTHALKTLSLPSPTVRKLVAHILIHLAPTHPDTALLAINTLQKSLSDPAPPLRALALRTMSAVRVPAIAQIVLLAIKRGAADMSPYVRRAAALALPKAYRLDPAAEPALRETLALLLADRQYFVAGAAVQAYQACWAGEIALLHPHWRKLVRQLVDMDEWGQLAFLKVALDYARRCFPRRTKRVRKGAAEKAKAKGKDVESFYDEPANDAEDGEGGEGEWEDVVVLDPDLELLLRAAQPLLHNRSAAVIIAVTRCLLYLGTPTDLDAAVGPLVALLRAPQDVQLVALHNIIQVCLVRPHPFVPYATHFLLRLSESPDLRRAKLELLTLLFPHSPAHLASLILAELAHFSAAGDPSLVRDAVRAIGRCALSSDDRTSRRCLRLLLDRVAAPDPNVVAESLQVVRQLVQRDPVAHGPTVLRLAKHLDSIDNPHARAAIIWLVGEFAAPDGAAGIAPDVLRILARGFADESPEAKRQIVLLAAKVYLHHLNHWNAECKSAPSHAPSPHEGDGHGGFAEDAHASPAPAAADLDESHPVVQLWQHVQLLARYDTSYDLRDRLRVYQALLGSPTSTELASLLLLAPKPVPQIPSPSESRRGYTLGSASLVVGDAVGTGGFRGYEPLPEWVQEGEQPSARLRDEEGNRGYESKKEVPASVRLDRALEEERTTTGKANGWREKTLDDWLEESDVEEEEESEESDEEETEEESSEEETEEETDDEDEDDESDDGTDDESAALRPSA